MLNRMLRPVLGFASIVFGLVLGLPAATAENLWFTVTADTVHPAGHGDIMLPENGVMRIPIRVALSAGNFTCLQAATIEVALSADTDPDYVYPEWAGAAVNPDPAKGVFQIPVGEPGPNTVKAYANKGNPVFLELEWNVENRPPVGARHVYKVLAGGATFTAGDGTCIQDPTNSVKYGSILLPIAMPDKNLTAGPEGCEEAPELPECQPETSEVVQDSPGPDVALFALGATGLVLVFRRRLK